MKIPSQSTAASIVMKINWSRMFDAEKARGDRLHTERAQLVEVLRELVELKSIKDCGDDHEGMVEYARRKPIAWEAARALLRQLGEGV